VASIFAIVSKKVFEKECADAAPGSLYGTDTYASTHKALDAIGAGDALFLATVRPDQPAGESLWLVAVLEKPKKGGSGWKAPKNAVPITDISSLRTVIRFTSGSGITDKPGALAMSLQTPRALTDADVEAIRHATNGTTAPTAPEAKAAPAPRPEPAATTTTATATPDRTIVYSDEARKYLRARSREDLALESPGKRKRQAQVLAAIERGGGIEQVVATSFDQTSLKALDLTPDELVDALLVADDDVRARCERAAEALWRVDSPVAARLLWTFPHRTDWALEAARAWTAPGAAMKGRDVLLSSLADRELLVAVTKTHGVAACVINIVPAMRESAAVALGEMFEHVRFPNEERALGRALGCIGTAEAAAIFVQHLRKKNVRPYATEFFATFPHLAAPALGELAKKKTQVAEIARTILTGVDRVRTASEAEPEDAGEEAAPGEWPRVLREPPWLSKPKNKRKPLTVPGLTVPAEPRRLHWSARARRRWVAENWGQVGIHQTDEEIAKLETAVANGEPAYVPANLPEEVLLRLLATSPKKLNVWRATPVNALALYGEAALPWILENHIDCIDHVLLRIESPLVAANVVGRYLSGRRLNDGIHWIERFPESAAIGLIPAAVGEEPKARAGAEIGLRHLARRGHRPAIERAADTYGAEARAAVDEILAWDDTHEQLKKPKMPSSYRVAEMRAPRLLNGKALPAAATEVLDQLLSTASHHYPPSCVDEIRRACEPRSLAEHVWDLAKSWDINGAKSSNHWMLHAVAHFGDDEVVRRLTPALKGEGIAIMLGDIGTDAALMELLTIYARVTGGDKIKVWPKYGIGTEDALNRIAARRGADLDDLEDDFVPTCDVDQEGGIALDLGSRKYRVTFDAQLARILLDESGERVNVLPRGAKDDDPEKVQAAATLLADLEEDVTAIADLRAGCLERAMVDGRTWTPGHFEDVWVKHPLMKHMARGVLWEAYDESGARSRAFRVAEDDSFANVDDDPFVLPAGTVSVGVAHPARFAREEREQWRTLFADYKLMQPFDQLAREPTTTPDANALAIEGPSVGDFNANRQRLKRTGWVRANPLVLPCADGIYAVVKFGMNQPTIGQVARGGRYVKLAEVAPEVRTELARAIEFVAAKE
jgi:hypothetical protein